MALMFALAGTGKALPGGPLDIRQEQKQSGYIREIKSKVGRGQDCELTKQVASPPSNLCVAAGEGA